MRWRVIRNGLRWLAILSLGALCACSDPIDEAGRAAQPLSEVEPGELELRYVVEAGPGPGQVSLRPRGHEVTAFGPTALAMGPNGVLHLADALAGRVVRIGPDRSHLPPLSAPFVEDVLVDGDGTVYTFSRVRREARVLSSSGQLLELVRVPDTMRLVTGLWPWPGGGAGLHTAYQESAPLRAQNLHQSLEEGLPGTDGARLRTVRRRGDARIEILGHHHERTGSGRTVVDRALPLAVEDRLGSVLLVGNGPDGQLVVDVQDVTGSSPLRVERWLRRYDRSGSLVSEVRLARGNYSPAHDVRLGPDGTAYVLVPTTEGVEVWAWPVRTSPVQGGAQ